ncbi:MAG: sigma-70 family RNA polymerase sigma factor [Clostridia bacterium]|nr:sigma-70 family RNA polymerase sigma factor [Clostridia bacterium]
MQQKNTACSDDEIIGLLFERDEKALALAKASYGPMLRRIAMNILGSPQDGEECESDALLALWKHVPPNRPRALGAYLSRIVRNIALDRLKAMRRGKRVPPECTRCLDELSELEDGRPLESEAEKARLRETVNGFVQGLDERSRFIFISRYYLFEPAESTAKKLGVSVSTVFKTLKKLRDELASVLKKEELL